MYVARPLTRFGSFAPLSWSAIRLNTASYLYAVHGSFIPFLLPFYGCPSLYTHCLNAALLHLSHSPFFPLYHLGSSTMNTAWSVHRVLTYLNDDISCTSLNLNLLESPL